MNIKPLADRVIIKALPMEEKTKSVGDRVIYSKYAGTEVKYDGVEYLILKELDVLAIVG